MPYTIEEQHEIQRNMYGMIADDVLEYLKPQAKMCGKEMLLLGMLSDVQHMVDNGQNEQARQLINRVKLAMQELEETSVDLWRKEKMKAEKA